MRHSSITTVLFDLDGTLIDTVELILESYRHTVRVHGLDPVSEQAWRQNIGIPLRVQFRQFTEDPDEIQSLIATYMEHNLEHHDDLVREYPGVCDAVKALHGAGYRLGVVASKMHGGLERGLALGGYDGLFEVLIGADDVRNPKPHAEPVLKALENLNVTAERAVFVGDSPHDMACAAQPVYKPERRSGDRSCVKLSNLIILIIGSPNLPRWSDCSCLGRKLEGWTCSV